MVFDQSTLRLTLFFRCEFEISPFIRLTNIWIALAVLESVNSLQSIIFKEQSRYRAFYSKFLNIHS